MNLAKTLEMIAESDDPIKLFYQGQIADAMIDEFNLNGKCKDTFVSLPKFGKHEKTLGGIITKLDLSEYKYIYIFVWILFVTLIIGQLYGEILR